MQPKINKTTIKPVILKHWYNTVGSLSCMMLTLLILGLLLPVHSTPTHATDISSRTIIAPSVSVAMTEPDAIDLTPRAEGQFGAVSSKLQVATTNSAGYSIYLNTQDKTNAMVNVYQTEAKQINAISTAQYAKDFAANTWGFALAREEEIVAGGSGGVVGNRNGGEDNTDTLATDLLYHPVPTASSLITSVSRATETDTYTLTFGANIDTALPAGQYANTVLVSVVANPQTIRSLSELTYMQEMSPLSCENSSLHETKQLIDSRDNQSYWVAKLADGNCWMVQNLNFDLIQGKTLTNKDTDLNNRDNWIIPIGTVYAMPKAESDPDIWSTRSWKLGNYYLLSPLTITSCTIGFGQTDASCSNLNGPLSSGTAQDQHYAMGVYYQFNTAVATSGGDKFGHNDNAVNSICPRGWKLPVGYDSWNITEEANPDTNGTYSNLLKQYGLSNAYTGIVDGKTYDIMGEPLYFPRAAFLDLNVGQIRFIGDSSHYWTSTSGNNLTDGRYFYFRLSSASNTMGYNYPYSRHAGMPIRCLAR